MNPKKKSRSLPKPRPRFRPRFSDLSFHQQPWIRIRICMFLGLPDLDPSLFCTDPDPSIKEKKEQEKPCFLLFCDFILTFYL